MTITDLINEFRLIADDNATPYLCSDAELLSYANDAEVEACRRGRLIFDDTTEAYCQIDVTEDTHTYDVNAKVHEITHARILIDSTYHVVSPTSRHWLDDNVSYWRESEGTPKYLILEGNKARLAPIPDADGTLYLDVYRLPATAMTLPVGEEAAGSPEIPAIHHGNLVDWMLHRAYEKKDSDLYSPDLSRFYENKFEAYFGPAVDSRQSRNQWRDRPHRNRTWE